MCVRDRLQRLRPALDAPASIATAFATAFATASFSLAPAAFALAAATFPLATVATATIATATVAVATATVATTLLHCHLWPLHRRSKRPELHSLAQLSVELRQQPDVLHHADRTRHRKAPDSNFLQYGVLLRLSRHT